MIDFSGVTTEALRAELRRRKAGQPMGRGRPPKTTYCAKCGAALPSFREAREHCRKKRAGNGACRLQDESEGGG